MSELTRSYMQIYIYPKIEELKRLQKEIDVAEAIRKSIIENSFGNWYEINQDELKHKIFGEVINTNQQKIKEIIEKL